MSYHETWGIKGKSRVEYPKRKSRVEDPWSIGSENGGHGCFIEYFSFYRWVFESIPNDFIKKQSNRQIWKEYKARRARGVLADYEYLKTDMKILVSESGKDQENMFTATWLDDSWSATKETQTQFLQLTRSEKSQKFVWFLKQRNFTSLYASFFSSWHYQKLKMF